MAKENNYNVLAKPTAKRGRNAFNLNNQQVYSMKAGLLNPVKAVHFIPGDYFKMRAKDFTISFPMKSAPFLRARKEFSFYSVYYSAVWSLFNQYMAGRQDPKSSAFGDLPVLQEPRIKLLNMYASVFNQFGAYIFIEHLIPAFCKFWFAETLSEENLNTVITNAKVTFFNDEYGGNFRWSTVVSDGNITKELVWDWTQFSWETGYNPFLWSAFDITPYEIVSSNGDTNPHNDLVYQDIVGHMRCFNQLRKLDMYGYGNMYPIFSQAERNIINHIDRFFASDPTEWSTLYTLINNDIVAIVYSLIQSFTTYSVDTPIPAESEITSYKMVNLYPLCSHNSIFYHFFRNSFYDNDYCNHDYSLDFVSAKTGGSGYNEVTMSDFSTRFLDCEYHQWKKDMFTSVLPDEQFGAVSSISLNSVTGIDTLNYSTTTSSVGTVTDSSPITANSSLDGDLIGLRVTGSVGSGGIYHTHEVNALFDMIALKRAEMLQEYRQTLMRAGNKTSDVFKALYGGAPSSEHLDDIIPRFLETFGEEIIVDPVISTANTEQGDNGKLGDISARAKTSGTSNEFKFDAGQNFGCIIALAYVVPTSMYNSYMLDKHLLELTPEQHFIPNFENCGLEDVFSDELNMLTPANSIRSLGKQARYYHKKTDVDKVHGAFCAMATYSITSDYDVTPQDSEYNDNVFYGVFNHWISSRLDMQHRVVTTRRDFYINPAVLDNVFVRAAGPDQADDQFICTTLFEIDATKAISKVGMVNFV